VDLVAEAADGREALAAIAAHRPDVVLLDIRMPVLDGIEVVRRAACDPAYAGVRFIMLTTFHLDDYVFDSLSAGASGFLLKSAEPGEMLRAVRVVAAGDALLSPAVTRSVLAHCTGARTPNPALWSALTEREREIVGLVALGLSNDEIATRLFVSPATVRTHVGRALTKVGGRDRAQLVAYAYRSGLPIPPV
jgi:DNA-binding NarL/FixJ family response regulator